jgi:predicted aldo/keto reductase-like oxidoreductase
MRRRTFLRQLAGYAGAAAFASQTATKLSAQGTPELPVLPSVTDSLAATVKKQAHDLIDLGNGVKVSRMALGTGTSGVGGASNQTRRMGVQGLGNFLRAAYDECGLSFWDSADQYGSHPHLASGLSAMDRSKVTLLTKTHATTAAEMRADLDRFRKELNTDYLDILLLHCMTDPLWPEKMRGAMDVISEAQQKGIVKLHGVSCHSLGALQAAAKEPWVQVDLARINPAGVIMDADVATVTGVLREMKKAGKAVIGMKIFGAGKLIDRREECLRFALDLDCVDCFSIGFESMEQLKQTTGMIAA